MTVVHDEPYFLRTLSGCSESDIYVDIALQYRQPRYPALDPVAGLLGTHATPRG
jgi:hypothetical protein